MIPALIVVLLLLIPIAVDVARRPSFRRLATRNISRRRGEALLVVAGSMLGTAIIASSFVVGDTVRDSIADLAPRVLGPIDEAVVVDTPEQLDQAMALIETDPIHGTDGTLPIVSARGVATTLGPDRLGVPVAWIAELDFDQGRTFGNDPATTGLAAAGPTPAPGEAVLHQELAADLEVERGDQIEVFAYGASVVLTVREVVPEQGLAGWNDVHTAPGTISDLYAASTVSGAQPPRYEIVVSNEGGTFEGALHTASVSEALEARLGGVADVEIETIKQDLLADAEDEGAEFVELFSGIGAFSVIAGVLLLVNLFVMLAEERKRELGILRAVGLRRSHLARSFAVEGAIYALASAIVGALAGIAVGWAIVEVIEGIFASDGSGLAVTLSVKAPSLVLGGLIGLAISLVTIWATTIRISRLNVIRAIRDLPEPPRTAPRVRTLILSTLGIVAGGALFYVGMTSENPIAVLAGPAVALFAAIPLLSRLVSNKAASIGTSALVLVWGVGAFTLVGEVMEEADIFTFVVQGVVLVAAAVTIVSASDGFWSWVAGRLAHNGNTLAVRMGLAYPLARRFRTGLQLGMFSLVIFTMTFLSVFAAIFANQSRSFVDDARAGHQIVVDSSRANPVSAATLSQQPEVAAVAEFTRGFPEFTRPGLEEPDHWALTGFDQSLLELGVPTLGSRLDSYPDDRSVFEAVLVDPSLAVINDFFLQSGGGPGDERVGVGDVFTLIDSASGSEAQVTVVGVMASDFIFSGVYMARDFTETFLTDGMTPSRHFVSVPADADPASVAAQLNGRLLDHGLNARTFTAEVEEELTETISFFRLLQGFLALGLVIGIAGLGVVLVRAVRERRREVGVLRAVGMPARSIRRAFLLEAGFVAVQGVVLGIGLGLLTAYQVLVNSDTFGEAELAFSWPWAGLAVVLLVPLVAAVGAALGPAARAAAIRPAAALRIAD